MTERESIRSKRETAFSLYLRTGRRIGPDAIEVKFNPWHDEENGRFTFRGQGRYFGATGGSLRPVPVAPASHGHRHRWRQGEMVLLIAIAFAPITPPIIRSTWSNRATRSAVSPPSARG
ncbi:putative protein OS=Sphingobium scionense OX=1404341 GN=GGQ90_001459 PE=4 SV=1 [Sphingobium scionense]|uniref:Uncharacterized protein n=2 Tax=Sphingobium scionense TaxID=1404341 RepID=A0A7W6LNN5_9SPHN|nr:hypothetical protein [Sphingobium scionense]